MNDIQHQPADTQEAVPLAHAMATAASRMLTHYRTYYKLTAEEAEARYREGAPGYEELIDAKPHQHMGWEELNYLWEGNPDKGDGRWEAMKQAALDNLQSGHRAAEVVETQGPRAWHRAQFMAIRSELYDGWQPRNGIERQLLDTMAQAQANWLYWLDKLNTWAEMESYDDRRLREEGKWQAPRVRDAECMRLAAEMADRFNKVLLRTLRALRDLRRYNNPVIVRNAGQVNVAGQQVNVS